VAQNFPQRRQRIEIVTAQVGFVGHCLLPKNPKVLDPEWARKSYGYH
jgi:hypothetical protein